MSRSMLRSTLFARSEFLSLIVAALAVLGSASLHAQLPSTKLNSIFPPGGQIGTELDVTVTGSDFDEVHKLIFSHPGISASQKMSEPSEFYPQASPVPGQFTVKISKDVPSGLYEARAVGRFGVSNPRAFAVGKLDELLDEGRHDRVDLAMEIPLGVTINGHADSNKIDYYRIPLGANQHVVVDCWGQRIDSKMDPTLILYDPSGQEIMRGRNTKLHDPVIDFVAKTDGPYLLAVYDLTYAGGADYAYRLSVHSGPYLDFVFPPVGKPGSTSQYTVYGRNLPGGSPMGDMTVGGGLLQKKTVQISLPADDQSRHALPVASFAKPRCARICGHLYQLASPAGDSNPVTITYATAPVVVEQEPNNDLSDSAQQIKVPCEYVGQFYPSRDRDWISFEAKKGDEYWVEVVSNRLGLANDPFLLIERVTRKDGGDEQVSTVATVDDPSAANTGDMIQLRSGDPVYRLKVDADATYRVMVKDLYGNPTSDPRLVYRLIVREREPDYQLLSFVQRRDTKNQFTPGSLVLRRGGTAALQLKVLRRDGFDGDVSVSVEGLPAGVKCDGAIVGGKVRRATLVFEADENAKPWAGPIRVIGKSTIDGKQTARYARSSCLLWTAARNQTPTARISRDLALAVIDAETAPVSVKVGQGAVVETSRGAKLDLPIKVTQREKLKGDLKLTAVGLPKDLKPKDVTVKGTDGKLQMQLTSSRILPGAYTFYLRGTAKYNYKRNQDAVKQAGAEQKRLAELAKKFADAAKQAGDARNKAQQQAQQAANDLKQAQQAKQNADRVAQQAAQAAKQAAEKLAQAKQAAAKDKENEGLAAAVKAAQQAADTADKKHKEAAAKSDDAQKDLDKAEADNKAAQAAKTKAEKAATEADQKKKQVDNLKKAADKKLGNAKNANKPRDINLAVASSPIRLRVANVPIMAEVKAPGKPLKQGGKLELPVSIQRKFSFGDKVDVEFLAPKGLNGVSGKKLTLDKGKSQGKLQLTAAAKATPGQHTATIRFRLRFNNVNLDTTESVTLKIEKSDQKAKN